MFNLSVSGLVVKTASRVIQQQQKKQIMQLGRTLISGNSIVPALSKPRVSIAQQCSTLMNQVHSSTNPNNEFQRRSFSLTNRREMLRVQCAAPEFRGIAVTDNNEFKEIKLSDYKGKYLVLFFYPLDFTFVCPTEIIAFSERYEEFKKINCEVIGCSTDSHFSHLAWKCTPRKDGGVGKLAYPLLADFTKQIASDYEVLVEETGVALRGLFIIGPDSTLRQMTVNDLPVGRSVDETLRLVKAFQFTDKHGEVCPADWQPEGDTIKPNPKGSKEYFEKNN